MSYIDIFYLSASPKLFHPNKTETFSFVDACIIYALLGTGGIQRPPLSCFAGHYCPPGTMFPTQYKCPIGTWSGLSGLEAERECRPCPPSWYCLAGSGAPSGRCNSGHYCPEGVRECDRKYNIFKIMVATILNEHTIMM